MSDEDFDRMLGLLQRKKNLILQGRLGLAKPSWRARWPMPS